ncbi:MAG: glycosyltransferase family 4 protein, partial [Bacteroidales bacterium]
MTTPGSNSTRVPATVAFVHWGRSWIRGSEQCLLDLIAHIDRARFAPLVVCNQQVLADRAEALGASALVLPELAPARVVASRRHVRELQRVMRERGARIIHANCTVVMPALVRVARNLRVPLVAHLHIVPTETERRHELLHQASLVVGVSQAAVAGFAEEGMPPGNIRVIYNAVDDGRIASGDATGLRSALGIPPDAVTLGAVCSLIHRKAVDVLLDALAVLRGRHERVHLIVAGDGDARPALEQAAEVAGIAPCVHFLGERRDAGAILRDAVDIAVTAAREESFGLNVIEAGYFGLAVVASDIPAHREAVVDGVTGILAPVEDPRGFAAAVSTLLKDVERRRRMGIAGRDRVRREFTMTRYVTQFERAYEELLERPARDFGWIGATRWPKVYSAWAKEAIGKRL